MNSQETLQNHIKTISEDRRQPFQKLFEIIQYHIPEGFELNKGSGMIGWSVPLSVYPKGYLDDKKTPLPFVSIAAQKRHFALYHMAIYADPNLLEWFKGEYPKHVSNKLNMGKSCIRFTNPKKIPFELIGELLRKVTIADWIELYEKSISKK